MIFFLEKVPVEVVGKPRMTQRDRWKKRPCVVKYREFCDSLIYEVGVMNRPLILDIISESVDVIGLGFTARIKMPKSWSKKKKKRMEGVCHQQTPDISNMLKAIEDALCVEDRQISRIFDCWKLWTQEESNVDIRLEVRKK